MAQRRAVDRETASLSQGTPKGSPGRARSTQLLLWLTARFQTPHRHLGLGLEGAGLVTVLSPEVITGSLESCQEVRNGHEVDLGGTLTLSHTWCSLLL